ncbi:MAG: DUF4097 family beta strand repeat-containing protein [Gemmatimonadaceae bacterium]
MRQTALALVLAAAAAAPAGAQATAAQPDVRWEKALAAGSTVRVHNLNGDVIVTASATDRVSIVGVRQGRERAREDVTIEVIETATGITVCAMFQDADMDCSENGLRVRNRRGWRDGDWDDARIDIRVTLPKSMVVSANSVSGNVSVVGAEGDVRAGSVSGDVRMEALRVSSVRATSVSGDVDVSIAALTGSGSLTFTSVSGDVTAELPRTVNADVTMRSVSGSLDSDFPLTLNGRMSRNRVEARIGEGGRDLEVRTVSGDVRLRSAR